MSTKFCAHALEWWLRQQGVFEGAQICTRQLGDSDQFEITKWAFPSGTFPSEAFPSGIPQPTDAAINQILEDYNENYVPPKTLEERLADLENSI